jgi:hypothetical protein
LSERDVAEISDWIAESSLVELGETDINDGVSQRLNASGAKVKRVQVGQRAVHPIYVGIGFRWERRKGTEKGDWELQGKQIESTDTRNSPFGKLAFFDRRDERRTIPPDH